ncbi:MAG: cytidine deaminase [Ignavibacteria bacterium]|nr:cytidine deaminase [Ignavibacteria bacterium]
MALQEDVIRHLVDEARAARQFAHAPYSGFHVGAALLASDGTVTRGCNVEISAYSVTSCAERTALFAAVAAGKKEFAAIAVVADLDATPPCGVCRQALADFNPSMEIILVSDDGSYRVVSLAQLLPEPFLPEHLAKHAKSQ